MEPEYTCAMQTEDDGGEWQARRVAAAMDTVPRIGYNCPPWAIPSDSLFCCRASLR
jgi:hypothetical protein